ncbi:hypothetical protein FRC17_001462 [Serendipita sp. 399]|nr:hypothetical protein FRC17_001462 [Serendipita sp. 399]
MSRLLALLVIAAAGVNAQSYTATYDPANLPPTTEGDQAGTNQCGTGNNDTSLCQNVYINNVQDFCLWGPQTTAEIGAVEQIVVSYCTFPGRGTRLIHDGVLLSAHFVETPDYIQVTGTGNFQNINIAAGDAGGELDPHGADGAGNPHGGLVFTNRWNNGTNGLGQQIHEWTNFMSVSQYCIRACKPGPMAAAWCQHIYDVTGCAWNMPADYGEGFTECKGDSGIPMGLYPQPDGSTSTFHQGEGATPPAHPAPSISACTTYQSSSLYAPTAFATASANAAATFGVATRSGTTAVPSSTQLNNGAESVKPTLFALGSAMPCLVVTSLLGIFAAVGILL